MATTTLTKMTASILAIGAILLLSTPAKADLLTAGIDLGNARHSPTGAHWGVFTLQANPTDVSTLSTGGMVNGDFGAAGTGKLRFSVNTVVNGSVYYHTGGDLERNESSVITGGIFSNLATDAYLDQGVIDARSASAEAFALPPTPNQPSRIVSRTDVTLTGSGTFVLRLSDLVLSSGATLTLEGTPESNFVINVTGRFSLSDAHIALEGGLEPDDVLFNVVNRGGVFLGRGATLQGVVLAPDRTVELQQLSFIRGGVVGNKVGISGQSLVSAF